MLHLLHESANKDTISITADNLSEEVDLVAKIHQQDEQRPQYVNQTCGNTAHTNTQAKQAKQGEEGPASRCFSACEPIVLQARYMVKENMS